MEHFSLNIVLLHMLNIGTHPASWQIAVGALAAKYLVYFFILFLMYQFVAHKERHALVITTGVAVVVSLGVSWLIGHLWPLNRPFADELTANYLAHAANSSFPSDHAMLVGTIAFSFLFALPRYWGSWVLCIAAGIVCWGRIYMGIHYPLDIVAGLTISAVIAYLCIRFLFPRITHRLHPLEHEKNL